MFLLLLEYYREVGEMGQNHKMVSLRFFNPLISKHIKNLFSKLGFYKITFKVL